MKTILAPTDFSDVSLNAVNYAAQMAGILGINLTLLHVCPLTMTYSDVPPPALYMEESISKAEKQLKELKAKILKDAHKKVVIKTKVLTGDVVSGIKTYCEVIDTYAVVMGADSSNAIDRFLFGGSTIEAIKSLSWPLIVVPSEVHFGRLHKIGLACDFRDVVSTVPVDEGAIVLDDPKTLTPSAPSTIILLLPFTIESGLSPAKELPLPTIKEPLRSSGNILPIPNTPDP